MGDVVFDGEGVGRGLMVGPGGRVGADAALGGLVALGSGDGVQGSLVGAEGDTGAAVLGAPAPGPSGLEVRLAQPACKNKTRNQRLVFFIGLT